MLADELTTEFRKRIGQLLDQSLIKIHHCVDQITDEEIWWYTHSGANSIGNLILHIAGNLTQWGVRPLNGEEDDRDRVAEFKPDQNIPKRELLQQVNQTVTRTKTVLKHLSAEKLLQSIEVQGFTVTGMEALIHTACHFQGHTHQIILLTRLIKGTEYRMQWSPESGRDQLPM